MARKFTQISVGTRKAIAEAYEQKQTAGQTPNIAEIARGFNVTYDQAYNGIKGRTKNDYSRSDSQTRKKRPTDGKVEQDNSDIFQLFEREQKATLLQLSNDRGISADERAKILNQVSSALSAMQRNELERHMKRVDARVVVRLVRMFKPDATEMDVIKAYNEAAELVKVEETAK